MDGSLVSIIIPVFNGEKTIYRAINSCLDQTYSNFEIIVVDNASTDSTRDIVMSFNSPAIKYCFLTSKGRSIARNEGLKRSTGKYIQFLDADDLLEKDKLKKAIQLLNTENTSAIQCSTVYIKGNTVIKTLPPYGSDDFYPHLLTVNTIPIHSMVIEKSVCKLFPENIEHCEDWIFWIESLKNVTISFDMDYVGASVIIHDGNTMSNIQMMKNYELLVLLRYRSTRLPIKHAISREVKIIKRYLEYVICSADRDQIIEEGTSKGYMFSLMRILIKNKYIKQRIFEKIKSSNQRNSYYN